MNIKATLAIVAGFAAGGCDNAGKMLADTLEGREDITARILVEQELFLRGERARSALIYPGHDGVINLIEVFRHEDQLNVVCAKYKVEREDRGREVSKKQETCARHRAPQPYYGFNTFKFWK